MHLGLLFEFPTLNGGENSMLAVIRRLRERDFRFTAFAPPNGPLSERLSEFDVPLVPFSVRAESGVKRDQQELDDELLSLLNDEQPDLLHSNSLSMSRLVGGLRKRTGCCLPTTGHLRDIMKLSRAAVNDLNQNDGLIAVSHATRDFHLAQGLNDNVCHVAHNGIDPVDFTSSCTTQDRETLFPGVSADAKILLNVGQICLRKGQRQLAESVCRLLQTRDDLHLALVGERHSAKQESIDYERSIEECFANSGCSHHLHLLGFRTDVARWMNAADLLVHTSRQEPFGRTLLEAAASQLPIVATDVGGTSEMLRQEVDALLVPPDDVTALDDAILRCVTEPDESRERGRRAKARISSEFRLSKTAEATAAFWRHHSAASGAE